MITTIHYFIAAFGS